MRLRESTTNRRIALVLFLIAAAANCRRAEEPVTDTAATATTAATGTTATATSSTEAQPVSDAELDPDVLTAPPPMDSSAPEGTPRYALEDATARGLIEYEVHGTGYSSGDVLMLKIRRLSDDAIDVYIVPGTVFVPGNSDAQSMVAWNVVRGAVVHDDTQQLSPDEVVDVTSMYLPDVEPRVFAVEAYCLNFDLDNPQPADAFQPQLAQPAEAAQVATNEPATAAVAPDVRAAQLIREGKRQRLSTAGIQVAIWADHNHKTKQEIARKFDATAEEMDKAFDLLLNTPPPKKKAAA